VEAIQDAKLAQRLRSTADGMKSQIEAKLHPAIGRQRATARRARIAASIRAEGERLRKVQTVLYGLADAAEQGTLPGCLAKVKSRAVVEDILSGWGPTERMMKAGITAANADEVRGLLEDFITPPSEEELRAKALAEVERKLIGLDIPGYFPTPREIVERMVAEADIEPGMTVLEPSAGKGNIADVIREMVPGAELACIELQWMLTEILGLKGHRVIGDDFMRHTGAWDRIIMNPPFERGQDIEHVQHAYEQLKPGGRLVSIMSSGVFFRKDRKAEGFRAWLDEVGGWGYPLPEGAFYTSERPTGVSTYLVIVDKLEAVCVEWPQFEQATYSQRPLL
jgi:hypothetical protein